MSLPAVSALGVRWRPDELSPKALKRVLAAAGAAGVRPLRRMRGNRAARLRGGQAAWLANGAVAVAAGTGGGNVVVVAGSVARVGVGQHEPVWVGPGEVVAVDVVGAGPWRVEAVRPPRCAPVLVRQKRYDDALLAAPGVDLAVTDTVVNGWTDAVVVAGNGDFVCPCGARFAAIADINDHYAVKLVGRSYGPLLGGTTDQRPAGVYTPPGRGGVIAMQRRRGAPPRSAP